MRISFDALRLCALVAAGVVSGYLWRAAFESTSPEARLSGTPRAVTPAPVPPIVRVAPSRAARPARHAVRHKVVRRVGTPSPALASRTVTPLPNVPTTSTPVAQPTQPTPAPRPQPTPAPTPQPKPPPQPTPAPPTASAAAPTSPTVETKPPPTSTTPPPPVTEEHPPPPTTGGDDGSRPGWGKGDKNHDHTGPGKKP